MGTVAGMLAACSSKPTDCGQQYKDGKFTQPFSGEPARCRSACRLTPVILPSKLTISVIRHRVCMATRVMFITRCKSGCAQAVIPGIRRQFGIDAWQMEGADTMANVQFTGYYTPVIQARHTRQGQFQYPIYRMPPKRGRLPSVRIFTRGH